MPLKRNLLVAVALTLAGCASSSDAPGPAGGSMGGASTGGDRTATGGDRTATGGSGGANGSSTGGSSTGGASAGITGGGAGATSGGAGTSSTGGGSGTVTTGGGGNDVPSQSDAGRVADSSAVTGDSGGPSRTPDAGGQGALEGGLPAGACNGVFCDDFERAALGADWTIDNSVTANVVEVVSTMAHSGTSSVHMKLAATAGNTFIRSTKGFPAPMNSLWGRVWLYVATTATQTGHDVYIEASNGMNITNTGVRPLNTQGGTMQINVAPPDNGADSRMALPRAKWTCFEWQIAATGAMGNVVLYMDGTQLATATNKPIPSLVFQRVGYEHYAAGDGGDLWIDDYAIGTSRLNCN